MSIADPWRFQSLLLLLLGLLSGCGFTHQESPAADTAIAELLHQGVHGTRTLQSPSANWITNPIDLKKSVMARGKYNLGSYNEASAIDFKRFGVLLIEMGQKSTGGYSIVFDPKQTQVIQGQTIIRISWNTPADGAMLTQAITSPFILLKIQQTPMGSITVLNQQGRPLFEILKDR